MKHFYITLFFIVSFFIAGFAQNGFITTWETTTAGESITIPTTGVGYDYSVNWGDGTIETDFTGDASHLYANTGRHTVTITGDFPRIYFDNSGDKDKILEVNQWGNIAWTNFSDAFYGCTNLDVIATDAPDLSNVTTLARMFSGCTTLGTADTLDFSNWDTSNVVLFGSMFRGASLFNSASITNWDVGKATGFVLMFNNAKKFNQDISYWNIGEHVTGTVNLGSMLLDAENFDQNLGAWNLENVTNIRNMLNDTGLSTTNYDATLIGWAENPNTPGGLDLGAANLTYCLAEVGRNTLTDIGGLNWSITDGGNGCDFTDSFITTWETTTADESITIPTTGNGYNYSVDWGDGTIETDFDGEASHAYSAAGTYEVKITGIFPRIYFNNSGDKDKILDVKQWGNIAWTNFAEAFSGCTNIDVTASDAPDLSNVTSLLRIFSSCTRLGTSAALDFSNWDTSGITSFAVAFNNTTAFNSETIKNWDIGSGNDFAFMFLRATSFNQDLSNWNIGENTTRPIKMLAMFINASNFNQSLGNWDISQVSNMTNMLNNSGLSQENYDSTLIGWATLETGETQIPSDITLNASATYCLGEDARNTLTDPTGFNWNITDGGQGCIDPVITILGDDPQIIDIGEAYTELGAEVTYGATLSINAAAVNTNEVGSYTVTYDATNTVSGATATQVTRMVEVIDQTLSINTPQTSETPIGIYPNPMANTLFVSANVNEVHIYNLTGALILTSKATTIDISNLASGMYLIKVFTTKGSKIVKVLKE